MWASMHSDKDSADKLRRRATRLLSDPASPRVVAMHRNLTSALRTPWYKEKPNVLIALACRPSWLRLVVWPCLSLVAAVLLALLWPHIEIDGTAISAMALGVLIPIASISIPLAVHTIRQRGRLLAQYFVDACRLHIFGMGVVGGLILAVASVVGFSIHIGHTPPGWVKVIFPSLVLGLLAFSLPGLGFILHEAIRCTQAEGRACAARYVSAKLAHSFVVVGNGRQSEGDLVASLCADVGLLVEDSDVTSYIALVESLCHVPRCLRPLTDDDDPRRDQNLWGIHYEILSHALGRGEFTARSGHPGPIAARFARTHARHLRGALPAYVAELDTRNIRALSQTLLRFYELLHSIQADETIPREIRSELYGLRGRPLQDYTLPSILLGSIPEGADLQEAERLVVSLHRCLIEAILEAEVRSDDSVVTDLCAAERKFIDAAQQVCERLGIARDAIRIDYDFWILLGHFVEHAVTGDSLSFAAAKNLTKDLDLSAPEELLTAYIALPEPAWDHPVYAVQRRHSGTFPLNVVQPWTIGPTVAVGYPGRELDAAFALLLLRSWRTLQQPPDIRPCPKPLGQVKEFAEKISEKADAWQLGILSVDKEVVIRWLEDCASIYRDEQRRKYLDTPLDESQKAEFQKLAQRGFQEGLTFSGDILAFIANDANTGAPLKWSAVEMPRSFLFREEDPSDLDRVAHDSGLGIATTFEQMVLLKWEETADADGGRPATVGEALQDAAEWLIATQECESGLIALVGHYDVREAACRADGFSAPTTQVEGGQRFVGTFRGHDLVWHRTEYNNTTRRVYAFDLSGFARSESEEASATAGPDSPLRLAIVEGRELATRLQAEGQHLSADKIEAMEGDVFTKADLGRLPHENPPARCWELPSL